MGKVVRTGIFFAFVVCLPCIAVAQLASSGPAALARQMPTIYGPYLANISRVRIADKQGVTTTLAGPVTRGAQSTGGTGGKLPVAHPVIGGGTLRAYKTTFSPTRGAFVPRQLAQSLGNTPDERRSIQETLTRCLDFYVETAKQKSVPLNDVALALNYYLSTSYFVYSNGGGPTQSQMNATRDMIRVNLAGDENFRGMSDEDKQEAYETLIVLAGFVDLGYGVTRQNGNESAAAQFREMAKHNLETLLGAPIAKIHYTDRGLTLDQ